MGLSKRIAVALLSAALVLGGVSGASATEIGDVDSNSVQTSRDKITAAYADLKDEYGLGTLGGRYSLKDNGQVQHVYGTANGPGGAIYASDNWSVGVLVEYGAIWDRYVSLNYENGWLGYPIGLQQFWAEGNVTWQDFQNGYIAVSADGNVSVGSGRYTASISNDAFTRDAVILAYSNTGAMSDASLLGKQTSAINCGLTAGGCSALFANGAVYATRTSSVAITDKGILEKYWALGAQGSWLGYPAGEPVGGSSTKIGVPANGAYQNFQNGTIIRNADGTYTVTQNPNWDGSDGSGCSYAQSGDNAYRDTICWLDMADYDDSAAKSEVGQRMSITLDGGYTASFTIKVRAANGVSSTNATFFALATPTHYAAGFGNTGFKSVAGKPALLVSNNDATAGVAITISDVSVRDAYGNSTLKYGLVTGDAESTERGEVVSFTSDRQLKKLAVLNGGSGRGCDDSTTSTSGNTVTCTGPSGGSVVFKQGPYWLYQQFVSNRSGNILYYAESPGTITQTIKAASPNAAVFGFMVTKATTTVNAPSDAKATSGSPLFTGNVSNGFGSDDGGLRVPAGSAISTEPKVFLSGENLTFTANTFSGTAPSWYRTSWTCTVNGTIDTNLTRDADDTNTLVIRNSDIPIGSVVNCAASIQLRPTTFVLQQRHWGS
ncbi:LGFP repeat-containing protein [Pseudoclavibacter soli]|uniref:LGFP repeat-containing protein n=1 Tax=Pseudoclavibacter soli TaxID=452623 RepID=UPI000429CE66|nr:hypothetical protein [Pseudoclavibacter soli]